MKKFDWGQTIAIVANVGVIASIVFLATEMRDNAYRASVESVQAIWSQYVGWQNQIATDDAMAEIYEKGLADFELLSPIQQARFDSLMRSYLRIVAQGLQARRRGVIDGSQGRPQDRQIESDILRHLDYDGFRQWWSTADRRGISGETVNFVEEMDKARQ